MIGNGHNDNIGVTMMLIMMGGQFAEYAAHPTTSLSLKGKEEAHRQQGNANVSAAKEMYQ